EAPLQAAAPAQPTAEPQSQPTAPSQPQPGSTNAPSTSSASPAASPNATPSAGSSAGAAPASGSDATVVQVDNHYQPGRLTVAVGATVLWKNSGTNFHTTTSFDGLWDSSVMAHDETFTYT